MRKAKRIIGFIMAIALIASLSVTAYAIDARSLGTVEFHSTTSTSISTRLGQFSYGEILRVQTGVYDSYGMLWWYGKPAPGTGIYQHYGYAIPGYSRAEDDNGVDLFTFSV